MRGVGDRVKRGYQEKANTDKEVENECALLLILTSQC